MKNLPQVKILPENQLELANWKLSLKLLQATCIEAKVIQLQIKAVPIVPSLV